MHVKTDELTTHVELDIAVHEGNDIEKQRVFMKMALVKKFRFHLFFQLFEFMYTSATSNMFVKLRENESIVGHVSRVYTNTPATLCTAR